MPALLSAPLALNATFPRVEREFFTLPLSEIFEAGRDLILARLISTRKG